MTVRNDLSADAPVNPAHAGAVVRLAFARKQHPELLRAEAAARLRLAAAIMAMDEALDTGPAIAEQHEVNLASGGLAAALADLVRGEANSSDPA